MNTIIPDIETLRSVVKINSSIPYQSIEPFLADALDIYIEPQVGNVIVSLAMDGNDTTLTDKIRRALGPLTLTLATGELGIQFGDSGDPVAYKTGKKSPANEAKIAAAKSNLFFRGMQALDRLLDYLQRYSSRYPDFTDHLALSNKATCFIRSANDFQDVGLIDIDYSTLTYRSVLPTLLQLQECNVKEMLQVDLYERLLSGELDTPKAKILRTMVIRYLANKTAELYTSQTSRQERIGSKQPEYTPLFRPVYQDMTDTGNFYAGQANYYAGQITNFITANAEDLGITIEATAMNFNSKEKKIFTSIS